MGGKEVVVRVVWVTLSSVRIHRTGEATYTVSTTALSIRNIGPWFVQNTPLCDPAVGAPLERLLEAVGMSWKMSGLISSGGEYVDMATTYY